MDLLAVVLQETSLKIGLGNSDTFRCSEFPLLDPTPRQLFQLILGELPVPTAAQLPRAVVLGSDNPARSGLLRELAQLFEVQLGLPAYVITEEHITAFLDESRLTGFSAMQRVFSGPKLSVWYAAHLAAAELELPVHSGQFVVSYIGEAVVTAAVQGGKIRDMSLPFDEGPFSVRSTGSLPFAQLLTFCQTVGSEDEALLEVTQRGGFKGYLGVDTLAEAEALAWVRHDADWIYSAFIYQLAKEIGAYAAILKGEYHAIVLTGPFLPGNGLRGLSAYFGKTAILNYPGDQCIPAALTMGQQLVKSGKEREADGF